MSETLRFGPYTVELSDPDKVLFPADGLTKRDLVDHYRAVAGRMVPLIENRPLTMQRFPDGIGEEGFYQKRISNYFPEWIRRARVEIEGGAIEMAVADNAATLAYLAQQACITPHVGLARLDRPDHPDRMIFDLDPAEDDFAQVRFAAKALHDLLAAHELPAHVATTGSRGVHVVVPLDRGAPFDDVRAVARQVADRLSAAHPDRLTTEQRKAKRGGRLFVDWLRNAYGQTAVAPYAVRARPGAPVACPVAWDELDAIDARAVTVANVRRRIGQADPWRGVARRAVSLKRVAEAARE